MVKWWKRLQCVLAGGMVLGASTFAGCEDKVYKQVCPECPDCYFDGDDLDDLNPFADDD